MPEQTGEPVAMIINHWCPEFTQHYGHLWPETYLCWDTEFTGGNRDKDLIMEIGHCMVRDRQVVDRLSIVLDWSQHDVVDNGWLRSRLNHQRLQMGDRWRVTWDVMKREGIHPIKALEFYYKLFRKWSAQGLPFVAHNGHQADERMFSGNVEGFLVKPWSFHDNELIDTGAIHKATQILESSDTALIDKKPRVLPRADDTMRSYFKRVVGVHAKGVPWRLSECLKYYGLDERYKLDMNELHTAGYDAYCLHLLMEEFRRFITHNNSGETGLESGAALERMFEEGSAQQLQQAEERERELKEKSDPRLGADVRARLRNRQKGKSRRRRQRSV